MGQIVKRKKRSNRASKSDLSLTSSAVKSKSIAPQSENRRSLRRRNARPVIDYDDYLDEYEEELMLGDEEQDEEEEEEEEEDEDEDDEDERRTKKKKLQSVAKLPHERVGSDSTRVRTRRAKRGEPSGEDDDDDDLENDYEDEDGGHKRDSREGDSGPGTPVETQGVVPLPDKKLLELILDKLQKKDIYGVYAEPVDPEELPDYFDIIKHPMDFATIRKKLANGKYSTLEQIEKDVFLICANAMQYNEPDTIYHKQAHAIQEMARKKFLKVRSDFEKSERLINTEDRNKFNHIRMTSAKRSICRSSQEPVRSDFLSGAALATEGESQSSLNLAKMGGLGIPFSNRGVVEGNISTVENDIDQVDELVPGKNNPFKLCKKSNMLDENRCNTYKLSNQLTGGSDSIFTTFEKEAKELVPVGLQAEYSYARSLARFAGTLGPVAWNIAAKNIKEASHGIKFGRGWVGEYEPLSTPFLKWESRSNMGSACLGALPDLSRLNVKVDQKSIVPAPLSVKDHPVHEPAIEGRLPFSHVPNNHPTKHKPPLVGYAESRPVTPASTINTGFNPFSRNHPNVDGKVGIQDVSFTSTANPGKLSFGDSLQLPKNSCVAPIRNTSQAPSKFTTLKQPDGAGSASCIVPTAHVVNSTFERSRQVSTFANNVSGPMARPATQSGRGPEQQGLSDPVHLMRMLAEKTQNQQNYAIHSPISSSPVMPSVPSPRRDDINNGSHISPRSWISVGSNKINKVAAESPSPQRSHISADSLYNPARDVPQLSRFRGEIPGSTGLHFQMEKNNLPSQTYGRENLWLPNKVQFQGHSVNTAKMVTADLSRFQVQSPRQSLTRPQTRQTFPPDLNVGFQPSASPARQGTQVDSQQPDLALQL